MAKKRLTPPWFSLGFGSLVLELSQSIGHKLEMIKFEETLSPLNPELIKNYLYVAKGGKKNKGKTKKENQKKSEEEKYILCLQCENKISRPIYRMSHQGSFDHTFLNPAGDLFHIGCFEQANGCVVLGVPSSEWAWFHGCQWQVAVCGQCLTHLGGFFQSEKESPFFGLILDALI